MLAQILKIVTKSVFKGMITACQSLTHTHSENLTWLLLQYDF